MRHPHLIVVEIDGYGQGGPLSHKRAYDLLIQAEAGACAVTGHPGKPAKPGPPVADISAGLYAALSIMALSAAATWSDLVGWLSATSENMALHVDMDARKTAAFPAEIAARLERMKAAHTTLPIPDGAGRRIAMPNAK